jgi:peptidoglycan/xylan/chitin deacetylase (PgdA/CDA1 family)
MKRRRLIRAGLAVTLAGLLMTGCAMVWLPDPAVSVAAWRSPDVIFRGARTSGFIALTIDDGPHPDTTPAILDVLDEHGAWATFFLLGENARQYPELVEEIRARGHEVGNHLMRDERSVAKGLEVFRRDLAEADSILEMEEPKWFRPGSGRYAGWMIDEAKAQGYRCVLASAHVQDVHLRHAGTITWLLMQQTGPGEIVVVHEGAPDRNWAPGVIDSLIDEWHSRGWQVGTVGDLMKIAPPRR